MTRIRIKDLPKDQKISKEEMKEIYGGTIFRIGPSDKPIIVNPYAEVWGRSSNITNTDSDSSEEESNESESPST